ncbi:hypothetical protein GCM10023321_47970 [Pseudonocardia eucalypti]|uniref:CBS domain-containing protein n=1 Tax=Pseudonocardia eucalypti TaxID=648755 RepID=A0ABP9QIZ0_9PSEU|nr:CBS domain-containing protein [Pseudonocardia eucalypti]
MAPATIVTTPEADATALARVMRSRHVLSVPVLHDGALVGIITRRDLDRAGLSVGRAG